MCLKITPVRKTCYNGYIDMVFPSMWPLMSYKFAIFDKKIITLATLI